MTPCPRNYNSFWLHTYRRAHDFIEQAPERFVGILSATIQMKDQAGAGWCLNTACKNASEIRAVVQGFWEVNA